MVSLFRSLAASIVHSKLHLSEPLRPFQQSPATSATSLLARSMYWCGIREMLAQLGEEGKDRLLLLQTEVRQRVKEQVGRLRGWWHFAW